MDNQWLNSTTGPKVVVASASSTSTSFMGDEYLRLRHQDKDDIESWSQRQCTRLHGEDCPCWRTLFKHLLHARHVYQSTQRCREMRLDPSLSFLPEMMDDMERMKEYIDDIIINIVGNDYVKGHIKDL